jgi:thiosulfate/3-mercaptopyruvate sulfurtransferase
MDRKGIARDDIVVIYGDKSKWWVAYALWVLTPFGHENVRLAQRRARSLDLREPRHHPRPAILWSPARTSRSGRSRAMCWRASASGPWSFAPRGERTHMPDYPEEAILPLHARRRSSFFVLNLRTVQKRVAP